jgi:hypothetical protein
LTELHENERLGHAVRHLSPRGVDEIDNVGMTSQYPLPKVDELSRRRSKVTTDHDANLLLDLLEHRVISYGNPLEHMMCCPKHRLRCANEINMGETTFTLTSALQSPREYSI